MPRPPGQAAALTDVVVPASGPVWAVGARLQGGRTRAFALRRDGGDWHLDDPRLDSRESGFTAVGSDPSGRVWAAGWHERGGVPGALIVERKAGAWSAHRVAGPVDGESVLTDLAFRSETEGYAVGYEIPSADNVYVPLLAAWDGRTWTRMTVPWDRTISAVLRSVAVDTSDGLLLAGARVARNSGVSRGIHARLSGGRWEVRLADTNPFHNSELLAAGYVEGRPMVVGSHAIHTLAFEGCGLDIPEGEPAASPDVARTPQASGEAPRQARTGGVRTDQGPAAEQQTRAPGLTSVRFRDVAGEVGLYEVTATWGGIATDFDGDGRTDVFYTRHNVAPPRLMLGREDGFRRAVLKRFGRSDRHACAGGDVDADGLTDLYCAHGAARGQVMKANELWLAIGRPRRERVTADYGVADPFGRGRTATFFHLDDDPFPELYVTNEPERVDGLPALNRLFLNDGGRRFLSAPHLGLDRSMGGICSMQGDIELDGDDDLLVCASEGWAGLPIGLRVFQNVDGELRHATRRLGLSPIGDQDVVMADFDGDGMADDLAQLGRSELRVSLWSDGRFTTAFTMPISDGVALGAGDASGDGVTDLYVVRGGSGNAPDLMLMNSGAGRSFAKARIPQARTGTADDVIVLDHDRNGLDDFLVLNGRETSGPIQLIAAFPR